MLGFLADAFQRIPSLLSSSFGSPLKAGLGLLTGGLSGPIFGLMGDNRTESERIVDENYQMQMDLSQKNYEHMLEKYEYDKALQQTMFNREDNAVQRRVADLKAAGLSPVLAAGSAAGAGPVVSTTAPMQHAADVSGKVRMEDLKMQRSLGAISAVMDVLRGRTDIAQTQAQTELTKQQMQNLAEDTRGRRIANDQAEKRNPLEITKLQLDIQEKGLLNVQHGLNNDLAALNISYRNIDIARAHLEKDYSFHRLTEQQQDIVLKQLTIDFTKKFGVPPQFATSYSNFASYIAEHLERSINSVIEGARNWWNNLGSRSSPNPDRGNR